MTDPSLRRSRLKLLLIVAVFAAPFLLSYGIYYGTDWRPAGHVNHGKLVQPARPLPELTLFDPAGKELSSADVFKDRWTLLYVGPSHCAERCKKALYYARQVHTALDRKAHRVQGVYIALDKRDVVSLEQFIAQQHQGLGLYVAKRSSSTELVVFLGAIGIDAAEPGNVYLIDPLGNWVLAYPYQATPAAEADQAKGMLKDIKKLLRNSHIG